MKEKIPDVKLYVVGQDWKGHKKILEKMVRRKELSKNVIFTGEVSEREKLNYMKKAEFFVSASEYEGFGISVVEAMAAGLPVVLNDIESFRNFVINGENGFIIEYSRTEEAKDIILKIMKKNNSSQISNNGKKRAREYDWKKLIRKIEDVYVGKL